MSAARTVQVGIITGFGINADKELGQAFTLAGGEVRYCHINDLRAAPESLLDFSIIAFPGGFSFGDHVGSGKILSHLVRVQFRNVLDTLIAGGGLILGICNGFQTLVKMGILPNLNQDWTPEVSLIHNESGEFVDRWVELQVNPRNGSPWLHGLSETHIEYPIRHGEGRFIPRDDTVLNQLKQGNLIAFQYAENPNGSVDAIAGITDETGRVLGLMPHPEAAVSFYQNPRWARQEASGGPTPGLQLLKNAVDWAAGI
ncbi:hypothetical protein DC28_09095 [Spirochaeta lutea]|uniref:Uncharacterized protein n=2 Tax=Spirochaeta lutea TaxID=1480694 RepID=A0A098QZM5_9SPIO|nr:hypothetical protein DC28_09095 [Spirochaeta lutea]